MKLWDKSKDNTHILCTLNSDKLVCTINHNDKIATKDYKWNYKWLKRGDIAEWMMAQIYK